MTENARQLLAEDAVRIDELKARAEAAELAVNKADDQLSVMQDKLARVREHTEAVKVQTQIHTPGSLEEANRLACEALALLNEEDEQPRSCTCQETYLEAMHGLGASPDPTCPVHGLNEEDE